METEQIREGNEEALKTQRVLDFFVKKGFLLDKELADFLAELDNLVVSEEIVHKLFSISKTRIINKAIAIVYFKEIKPLLLELDEKRKKTAELFFMAFSHAVPALQEENALRNAEQEGGKERKDFKILFSKTTPHRKIEVKDFITHFKNRYNFLKNLLKARTSLTNLISIDKIGNNRDFSIIGLVTNKRITKNKNVLLEVEDLTGRISALVNQTKPDIFEKTKEILLDDVIGLKCNGGRDMVFVNDIYFPDANLPERKKASEEVCALFTSDIHIGSTNCLNSNFERFIEWLNSNSEITKKIKYLFILGDNVDGVGVYPLQESLLDIKDIKEQYATLSGHLKKVPKHITMFMCPGQHDAVRVPEPQPPIDEEFAESLTKIANLHLISNPALVEINSNDPGNSFKVLMYHGASMANWIGTIDGLRVSNAFKTPAKVASYLLRHRHLSPTHSATTYVPDKQQDALLIQEVPDIFAIGDLHKPDIDTYHNILIISGGCWQSTTPYEEKVGNQPDPCKVPMLNLKTREIKILDFTDREELKK